MLFQTKLHGFCMKKNDVNYTQKKGIYTIFIVK